MQDHTQQAVSYPLVEKIACHANKGIDGPMSQDLVTPHSQALGHEVQVKKVAMFCSIPHVMLHGLVFASATSTL